MSEEHGDVENDEFFEDLMAPGSTEVVKVEDVQLPATSLDEDFARAKKNLEEIARDLTEASADAAEMARQMAEPRGYDALSKVGTAAMNANKAVVELYKNKSEGKEGEDGKQPTQVTTHNTVFMTTAEMAEHLKKIASES